MVCVLNVMKDNSWLFLVCLCLLYNRPVNLESCTEYIRTVCSSDLQSWTEYIRTVCSSDLQSWTEYIRTVCSSDLQSWTKYIQTVCSSDLQSWTEYIRTVCSSDLQSWTKYIRIVFPLPPYLSMLFFRKILVKKASPRNKHKILRR